VLVGSDDPVGRKAITAASRAEGISILDADSVSAVATELAGELEPDIVLIDVQLAPVDALLSVRRVRAAAPDARILVFSSPAATEFGVLCIKAGADGYLSKNINLGVLPNVLGSLGTGEAAISRAFATELVERVRRNGGRGRPTPERALAARERQVVELAHAGLALPEIASELGISLATARRHLLSVHRLLSVERGHQRAPTSPPNKANSESRKPSNGRSHDT
jgi:two-component system nitrate/nitrite response regulator NarL